MQIAIYDKNPYYWQIDGQPVLLLGGSIEDNLFQIPDLEEHLDSLVACGGNYVRNTMSSRDEGNVWPFGEQNGVYNLDTWNEEYWQRFSRFLAATADRGIVVQIEVWDRFDFYRNPWQENPFNPKLNVNYTEAETGLKGEYTNHPGTCDSIFFKTAPGDVENALLLKYQERFVDKMLSYSLQYGHVLYCMDNETNVSPLWGAYWSKFIKEKAGAAGKRVYTTEMWDAWNLADAMHNATLDHPEIYDFVDTSQNNHQVGPTHWANLVNIRQRIANAKRPLNNTKTYGGDDRFGTAQNGIQRFWQSIFAGAASARFHRPPAGIGLSAPAQHSIRAARTVTNGINVFALAPRPDLLATMPDEGACLLANPGHEYALYLPNGASVEVLLETRDAGFQVRWYDIEGEKWVAGGSTQGGRQTLTSPGAGQWVGIIG